MNRTQPTYDYTSKRIGSKQPPYGSKVIVCAKCGKRGTDGGRNKFKRDGQDLIVQNVTHRSHISDIGCLLVNHMDEHCSYFVEAPEAIPA